MVSPDRCSQMGPALLECAVAPAELIKHTDGNTEHGRKSQAPANDLTPPWVNIQIVVGQRLVVKQMK